MADSPDHEWDPVTESVSDHSAFLLNIADRQCSAERPAEGPKVGVQVFEEVLFTHTIIRVHHGKTQIWNRGGVMAEGIEGVTQAARWVKPDCVVGKEMQSCLTPNKG